MINRYFKVSERHNPERKNIIVCVESKSNKRFGNEYKLWMFDDKNNHFGPIHLDDKYMKHFETYVLLDYNPPDSIVNGIEYYLKTSKEKRSHKET